VITPRTAVIFLVLGGGCHAAETWTVPEAQRDPGALAEMFDRLSGMGAKIWREGSRFLIQGELHDLPRETGVEVQPWRVPMPANLLRAIEYAPEGSLNGTGAIVTLDHAENAAFMGTSFLLDRVEGVAWAGDGTIVLDSAYASGSSARALNFARQFGLRVTMVDSAHPAYELKRPRLGIATREAWVVSLLDRYNVPYTRAESQAFDTMVFDRGDPRIDKFASGGGMAICLPTARGGEFTRVTFEVNHPVAFGMPHEEWARSGADVLESGAAIARFTGSRRAAITGESRGKGQVVSFAFRPDTYATCKLLLNAVYFGSARRL
jgi:hypothetical protein